MTFVKRWLRLTGILLVFGIVMSLLAPGAASAADIPGPPPKVDPVYDLPSTWPSLTEEEATLRKHEIDMARRSGSPKWLTRPVDLKSWRGLGGAAGWAFAGFEAGFQITATGVQMAAAIGGDEDWYCGVRDAYAGTGSWAATYFAPMTECPGTIGYEFPNSDTNPMTTLAYSGHQTVIKGSIVYTPYTRYCLTANAQVPAGYRIYVIRGAGGSVGSLNNFANSGTTECRNAGFVAMNELGNFFDIQTGQTFIRLEMRNITSQQVVAESVAANPDPNRQARCKYRFNSGAPDLYSEWVTYKDSTGFPGSELARVCELRSESLTPEQLRTLEGIGIEEQTEGGSITEIADSEVPSEMQQYQEDHGIGRKALILVKTLETGSEVSCLLQPAHCTNWWADTEQGTVPGQYRCLYGGTEVDFRECAVYQNSFLPGVDTPVITDPETGEEHQWGGQTDPGNSINPGTGPGTGDNPSQQCMASWSAAPDPLQWVLHPVKCALAWAFVPRTSKVTEAQTRIENKWRESAPGKLAITIAGITPVFADLTDGTCGGLILPVPKLAAGWSVTTENRAFLAACPGDFFAPWAPLFYWLITGALGIAGFFMVKRSLDKFVGNT